MTEKDASGWTIDTMYAHLKALIDARNQQLDERYATQTRAIDAAFDTQQTAMQTAFAAAEKAVDQRATTLDREFHEHLEQVRHENALAFLNSDKAVQAALTSQKDAVTKAETATNKRFESVNEFRGQLNDQAALFLPRTEYDARHTNLEDRVTDITNRLNRSEGSRDGVRLTTGTLVTIITVAVIVIGLVVAIANYAAAR